MNSYKSTKYPFLRIPIPVPAMLTVPLLVLLAGQHHHLHDATAPNGQAQFIVPDQMQDSDQFDLQVMF